MTLVLIVAASSFRARSRRSSYFVGFGGDVLQICGIWEDHAHLQTDFTIALSWTRVFVVDQPILEVRLKNLDRTSLW